MRTGLHANDTKDHAKILDYYRRSGSRVFKTLVFHDDLLTELRSMGVVIIGRIHFDQNEQKLGGTDGKNAIKRIVEAAERHPAVALWEGYNEAFQGPKAEQPASEQRSEATLITRYAEWEIARMEALEAIGRRALIGNFSTGTPDLDTDAWPLFRPALTRAFEKGHALGLHEYAGPYMMWMLETPDGKNQWVNGSWTGASMNGAWADTIEGWLTLRYRKVWRKFLQPWGIGALPIYIGEGGIDDTTPRPGPAGKGYKALCTGAWARLPGIGTYPEQRYWYMVQTTHDNGRGRPLAAGVVDFGWEGTATDWPDFDMATDSATVNAIIASEQRIPAEPPWLPWTSTPPPERPVIQGTDVSHHQGRMTWPTTKAAGVTFAFIKSSEGSAWVDPRFAENAAGAAAAGILWGPYHYYNNKLDPVAQARHFVATVGRASAPPTLRFALDFEDKTTPPDPAKMERFAVEVEKLTGARPIVYTAAWWWNRARLGRAQPWAARLPLWLADYSPEHIDLPNTGEWQRANVLQFTSSGTGSTYGAESARIDLDTYDGTRDALIAELGYTPPTGIDLARLQREARDNHVIRIFAGSALLQAIHAAGLVPVSNEWEFSPDHQAQVGESFDGTRAAVFVWSRKTNQVTPYPRG